MELPSNLFSGGFYDSGTEGMARHSPRAEVEACKRLPACMHGQVAAL